MKTNKLLSLILPLAVIPAFIAVKSNNPRVVKPDVVITVPAGFETTVIADNLGQARHMAVTPQGDIYVRLAEPVNGKGILLLHPNGDRADVVNSFGDYGGTGVGVKNGYLYASSNDDVFRYKLNDKSEVIDPANPEKIITGLPNHRTHAPKAIALDNDGNIYVNVGAYSNICTEFDPQAKGCPILKEAGGIWKFKVDKLNQTESDGTRYATGLRTVVGLDWNQQDNQLFVMQHGRDNLHNLFPNIYTVHQSTVLPAECMYALKQGDDAGWPYLYYDWQTHKKMVGPEYGGDGKKEADSKYLEPVASYPGHYAPNGLLFYTGSQFPAKYKNGAFIAFHGSWNRAPEPQAGYCVVFQPFKDGKPYGDWEVFADGFSGSKSLAQPGDAAHRPVGLAQSPDGSLYVSDDVKGTIYKITYHK
jgi:glucose/arabinose dehydrogenase